MSAVPLDTLRADLPVRSPFNPFQRLRSLHEQFLPSPAHVGVCGRRLGSWRTEEPGILFGSAMATAAVKGTGLVLCCSVNGQDSAGISGLLLGRHQTI